MEYDYQRGRFSTWVWAFTLIGMLVLMLAGGLLVGHQFGHSAEQAQRENLLAQARAMAHTMDPAQIAALSFTAQDLLQPQGQRLRSQLLAYAPYVPHLRWAYLVKARNGTIVFGVDSTPASDPAYTPPGDTYTQAAQELHQVLQGGEAVIVGPYTDEWGSFVSAFVPVRDPRTGHVLAALGLDIDTADWQDQVRQARRIPTLFTPILLFLCLALFVSAFWSHRLPARWRHIATGLCALLGLVFTIALTSLVRQETQDRQRASFSGLGQMQAQWVRQTFHTLRGQLDSMARFFESSAQVDHTEFRNFSQALVDQGLAQGWGWIPAVPAGELAALEQRMRQEGWPDFFVCQMDEQGRRVAATGRNLYYPLVYAEPAAEHLNHLGDDQGSDPVRRAAVEEALRSGRASASEPVLLTLDSEPQPSLIILQSVQRPAGLVAATVFLKMLFENMAHVRETEVGLFQLQAGQPARLISATDIEKARQHGLPVAMAARPQAEVGVLAPIFVFGRAYAVLVHPSEHWLAEHHGWASLATALAGLLLTALATVFVAHLISRPIRLENIVRARTRDLRASEEKYRSMFENNHAVMLLIDPATGAVIDGNPAAEQFYGWSRAELRRKHIREINTLGPDELQQAMERAQKAETRRFLFRHRRADGSVRDVEVFSGPIVQHGRTLIYSIVHDITESKRNQDSLLRVSRLNAGLSRLNQAVVGATSRSELFDTVCRVMTEVAQLHIAWIGWVEEQTGQVKVIAQHGDTTRYLDQVHMSVHADKPEGQSPTGACIRENRVVICTEFKAEDCAPPWQQAARQAGIRSSAALPIRLRGVTRGALNVYASEPDFFGLEERSLLEETARSLSFALDYLEGEAQNAKLRRAIEHSPATIVITDREGRIEYVNPKFTEVSGYTAEEALGQNPKILSSREKPPEEYRGMWATLLAGRDWRGEFHNKRKDGSLYWELASISPLKDAQGQITHFVAVKEDITERKRTESALRESEQKYRLLAENATDAIWVLDLMADRFTFVSPAITGLLGYSVEEFLSQGMAAFLTAEDVELARSLLAARLQDYQQGVRESYLDEFYLRRKDGTSVWCELSTRFFLNPERQRIEVVGVNRDISARKQTEAEKADLNAQLLQAQKMEGIGRLAGGIAHDFNNLLQAIIGFSEILHAGLPAGDARGADVLEITRAAQRAAELTRQLLVFSRQQPSAPQVLDLNALVLNSQRMLGRLLGEDIHIELELAPTLNRISADPGQMGQVLMNLVVNARDAMSGRGTIIVRTENRLLDIRQAALVTGARPGGYVTMEVCDTGIGIPPEILPQIFEPFFTTKATGKGTGLGLPVVYGIVQQHSGFIQVKSEPGQGTCFTIALPAYASALEEAEEDSTATPEDASRWYGHGECLLVVEDEEGVREFLNRALRLARYEPLMAVDLAEARTRMAADGPRIKLVLSDVVLPDGNGLDLAAELRRRDQVLPIILASGYQSDRSRFEEIKANGFSFLQKPYAMHELLKTLHQHLHPPA